MKNLRNTDGTGWELLQANLKVVFSLPINKNGTTYKKLFQILIELNGRPTPTLIKTDFEQASISAARSQFPNAKISGCLFHLGQAIQRRIAEEGLKKYYNDNLGL